MSSRHKEEKVIIRQRPSSYHAQHRPSSYHGPTDGRIVERRYVRRVNGGYYDDDSDGEVVERRIVQRVRRPASANRVVERRVVRSYDDSDDDYLQRYQRQISQREENETEDDGYPRGHVHSRMYRSQEEIPKTRTFYVRSGGQEGNKAKVDPVTHYTTVRKQKPHVIQEYYTEEPEIEKRDVGVQMTTQYRIAPVAPVRPITPPKKVIRNVGTQTKKKKAPPPPTPPRTPTPPPTPPREPTPPPPPPPPKPPAPLIEVVSEPMKPVIILPPKKQKKPKVMSSYHYVRVGGGWKKIRHKKSDQHSIEFPGLNTALIRKYLAVTYHGHTGFWNCK